MTWDSGPMLPEGDTQPVKQVHIVISMYGIELVTWNQLAAAEKLDQLKRQKPYKRDDSLRIESKVPTNGLDE